jgi:hypothetical protein
MWRVYVMKEQPESAASSFVPCPVQHNWSYCSSVKFYRMNNNLKLFVRQLRMFLFRFKVSPTEEIENLTCGRSTHLHIKINKRRRRCTKNGGNLWQFNLLTPFWSLLNQNNCRHITPDDFYMVSIILMTSTWYKSSNNKTGLNQLMPSHSRCMTLAISNWLMMIEATHQLNHLCTQTQSLPPPVQPKVY